MPAVTVAISSSAETTSAVGETLDLPLVEAHFPSLHVRLTAEPPDLFESEWNDERFDFWRFDRKIEDRFAKQPTVFVGGEKETIDRFALQVATRSQRLLRIRNRHSRIDLFDSVLRTHRKLHDLELPLVRADYDHALDVWQWLLRLERDASFELQVAALFHDVERLLSEKERRIEHRVDDYEEWKKEHARRGATFAATLLDDIGVDPHAVERISKLIEHHEQPPDERESASAREHALLNDADALSFFSLNSPGFFDYYPPAHCRRKVAFTLRRLSPAALPLLQTIRLRGDVAAEVNEHLRGTTCRQQPSRPKTSNDASGPSEPGFTTSI